MSADALTVTRKEPGKLALLGLPASDLLELFESIGEKSYRAKQLMRWLYQRHEVDFNAMTDLSAPLRKHLAELATIDLLPVMKHEVAADGTQKWLLDVGANQAVETVFIPEADRGTLCISSQAGCALDCAFCATGRQGFNRNLTAAEIIGQVVLAARAIAPIRITNVVFMGMGEPLANYRNVLPVVNILVDDQAYGISRRRVTISTSGVVPQMLKLVDDCDVALAVSLHAPTDELRNRLVPINRVHPIAELLDACWKYAECLGSRDVVFEYVMLEGVNDSPEQARALAKLLRNRPAKVNLIPFNAFPESEFRCSSQGAIDEFWRTLRDAGIMATVRRARGDDIAAACGQLAGRVRDRQRVRLGDRVMGASSS